MTMQDSSPRHQQDSRSVEPSSLSPLDRAYEKTQEILDLIDELWAAQADAEFWEEEQEGRDRAFHSWMITFGFLGGRLEEAASAIEAVKDQVTTWGGPYVTDDTGHDNSFVATLELAQFLVRWLTTPETCQEAHDAVRDSTRFDDFKNTDSSLLNLWTTMYRSQRKNSTRLRAATRSDYLKARQHEGLLVRWENLPLKWREVVQALDQGPLRGEALSRAAWSKDLTPTRKDILSSMVQLGILGKNQEGYYPRYRFTRQVPVLAATQSP
jgi:hypothetical protein